MHAHAYMYVSHMAEGEIPYPTKSSTTTPRNWLHGTITTNSLCDGIFIITSVPQTRNRARARFRRDRRGLGASDNACLAYLSVFFEPPKIRGAAYSKREGPSS